MDNYDVIIIGGGLAGLTAAIQLAMEQYNILLLERYHYPHHKVCGEYVSNEVMPYLEDLGIVLPKTVSIDTLQLSTRKGKLLQTKLPLGGFGISRYAFDHALYKKALSVGVSINFETVKNVTFFKDSFNISTEKENSYSAKLVIGAYGKRSGLDKQLNRNFIGKNAPWLGVKAHYALPEFPDNLVALHNFEGGYGGLSKTETGAVNFCYLVSYKSFQAEKNIENFNSTVVAKNKFLKQFLENAEPLFTEPMSIAQVSFDRKQLVEGHILMCGDTAGLIHPLCGNGMAMAIHSAKIASERIDNYFKNSEYGRSNMESDYKKEWEKAFKRRLQTGRILQSILLNPVASSFLMGAIAKSPGFIRSLIKNTHGKPISL
ncbi:NAD(P)/FAD-dependent oxidoreductase [Eudoraea sp.]|uniref:NAD(P)/FAD-dependent oxidoreductase n=1 Tax=Eudoraea sp. TaxID=1979955 RepID=UPI003C77815E